MDPDPRDGGSRRLLVPTAAAITAFVVVLAAVVDGLRWPAAVLAVATALYAFVEALRAVEPVDTTAEEPDPLPIVDLPPDDLYGEAFLVPTLEARVATARRTLRPLAVVYFEVVEGDPDTAERALEAEVVPAIKATLRESDVACRLDDGSYAIVLEDTSEDGAVWTAERMRRNLHSPTRRRLFRAGVAAYPTSGLDAVELQAQARRALLAARDWRRDRIEVADHV